MKIETLNKANELNKRIKEFETALDCFEYAPSDDESKKISTDPRLIIDYFGDDCRQQQALPMNLSNEMVAFLKAEIIKGRDAAIAEFNAL